MAELLRLAQAKLFSAISCFALAVLGCWVAHYLERDRKHDDSASASRRQVMLMFGNTLAAGILLSAGLVHMLPDAMEALAEVSSQFPVAPTIAGASFVFLVLLGELAESWLAGPEDDDDDLRDRGRSADEKDDRPSCCITAGLGERLQPQRQHQHASNGLALRGSEDCYRELAAEASRRTTEAALDQRMRVQQTGLQTQPQVDQRRRRDHPEANDDSPSDFGLLVDPRGGKVDERVSTGYSKVWCQAKTMLPWPPVWPAGSEDEDGANGLKARLLTNGGVEEQRSSHNMMPPARRRHAREANGRSCETAACNAAQTSGNVISEIKSCLLFFALVFHSVMEGLGVGSAEDAGILLGVLIAIVAHKALAAFALGSALMQSRMPAWKFWTFVAIFSMSTPIGCVIGAISADVGSAAEQSLASGLCIAMASGTFLKVSTTEMLPRALAEKRARATGAVGLTLGFSAMSILAAWC